MRIRNIEIPPKYIKIFTWIVGGAFTLFFIAAIVVYFKREALLKVAINKGVSKAKNEYGLNVTIKKAGFSGLSTVNFQEITVVPFERDTLSSINRLSVGIKLFPLLFGNVKLSEINLENGLLNVVFRDSTSNLDFLKRKKAKTNSNKKVELSDLAHNFMNQILYKIPDDMEIKNLVFKLNDHDTAHVKLNLVSAIIDNGELNSTIIVNDNYAKWHLNGDLDPGSQKLEVKLFADNKAVELPYVNNKFNGTFSFDTVYTKLDKARYKSGDYVISGSWAIKNLKINQQKLTTKDIIFPDTKIEADVFVGPNYVGLDSTSKIIVNKAVFTPFIKYTLNPSKIYEFKFRIDEQPAQEIINSFPVGLFESVDGMQVQGNIKYNLEFLLDEKTPDSLKFNSTITPVNFKILKWGKTDLQYLNNNFIYTPFEFGKPMRSIMVGPMNPNYVPIGEISDNFKNAILTSEDPSFFRHNGFVEESIRTSIAVNFKEKKFKRGGSTISMQLVKNAFLSRHKALSRKAEEILIVWLIEYNKLISKRRMLEVYLNIIEMGYNVYGIGEASRHYFGKSPAELTQGEGIFLASIVPKPKASLYKFNSDGSLKPYMLGYFNSIGNLMSRRGLTSADSTGYGFYSVRLKEGLRYLLPKDSAALDTLTTEDDDGLLPLLMQDNSKKLFDKLFPSTNDTLKKQPAIADTTKTRKQIRQERRQERKVGG